MLRVDGASTECKAIAANVDGGATLLCTFHREAACGLRVLGADGEIRSESERVSGTCGHWAGRADGGGYMTTSANARWGYGATTANLASLDANGRVIAKGAVTSKSTVYINHVQLAADGDLVAALSFTKDVSFRGKRLGTTKFTTEGVLKFRPTLDRLAWSRIFSSRRTYIADFMPPTHRGVDVVMTTRGPLVPGGPINPPVNPEDGSVFGGDSYGWQAERVAFDRKGADAARTAVAEPGLSAYGAAMLDDTLAVIVDKRKSGNRADLLMTRANGERETVQLGILKDWRFADTGEGTWVIQCECEFDSKKGFVGPWVARELDGRKRSIELRGPAGKFLSWTSLVVRGDVIAATGPSIDPTTQVPTMFVAIGRLSAGAVFEPTALKTVDKLQLAPGCRRDRPRASFMSITTTAAKQLEPQLEACGVPPNARVSMTMFLDGGIDTFAIEKLSPTIVACARALFEPLAACPTDGTNVSFGVRITPKP